MRYVGLGSWLRENSFAGRSGATLIRRLGPATHERFADAASLILSLRDDDPVPRFHAARVMSG
jgi:hypothetical protein